jgi:phage-related protein
MVYTEKKMLRELQISIKKVRSELKRTTDDARKMQLRHELNKLKQLIQKEKLAS